MNCPKCQVENRDSAKFCIECGEKIADKILTNRSALEGERKLVTERRDNRSRHVLRPIPLSKMILFQIIMEH